MLLLLLKYLILWEWTRNLNSYYIIVSFEIQCFMNDSTFSQLFHIPSANQAGWSLSMMQRALSVYAPLVPLDWWTRQVLIGRKSALRSFELWKTSAVAEENERVKIRQSGFLLTQIRGASLLYYRQMIVSRGKETHHSAASVSAPMVASFFKIIFV